MPERALLTGPLEPTNEAYAIAKIAGIKLCESYNREYGTDFRSVMPTNLYGPGDNFDAEGSHVIPGLTRRIHEAKVANAPSVTIWGSGKPRREFLHVDDLAQACLHVMALPREALAAATEPMCSHLNVGTGEDLTIAELARLIADTVGYQGRSRVRHEQADGTPRKLLDVSKLSALGWHSTIGLAEGLLGTYEWYVKQNGCAARHEPPVRSRGTHRRAGNARRVPGRAAGQSQRDSGRPRRRGRGAAQALRGASWRTGGFAHSARQRCCGRAAAAALLSRNAHAAARQPQSERHVMSESIRDQLLALGLAKSKPPEPRRETQRPAERPKDAKPAAAAAAAETLAAAATAEARPPAASAGCARAGPRPGLRHARETEREAQAAAQREAEQKAREKKERKAKLTALLSGKSLNDANAEHARHFEHHGKIRRIYVTPEQLARLNRGELGVVQLAGRYFLVERECALAAAEIDAEALVLLPEPGVDEDGVPADLVW
jgi:GDP-L-fucose synthase